MRIEKNFNIIKSLINTGTNPAALAHNNFPTSLFPDDRFYIDNLALTIKSLYPIAKIGNRVFRIGYVDFGQIDKKELIRCAHFKSHSTSFFLIFFLFYFILRKKASQKMVIFFFLTLGFFSGILQTFFDFFG